MKGQRQSWVGKETEQILEEEMGEYNQNILYET